MESYNFTLNTTEYNKEVIKSKLYTTKKAGYTILNNNDNKDTLTVNEYLEDTQCSGLYNSVILIPDSNMVLSYSPPTEVSFNDFALTYPIITPNICVNELIEGTLIHLFYDFRINSWEIATKNAVGGDYWFYRTNYAQVSPICPAQPTQMTFRDMFIEAFTWNHSETCEKELNDIECFATFDKCKSYCFVLQHPQNHIILPVVNPTVYLVGIYGLNSLNEISYISPFDYENWDCFTNPAVSNIIQFPKRISITKYNNSNLTYDELKQIYCSVNTAVSYNSLLPSTIGLILTDTNNGMRTVIMNPIYESIKELRGNNPNLQYHYFTLLKTNKIALFLTYFPLYRHIFDHFNKEYNRLITNVHQCYYKHYVLKNYENVVSGIYRTHIFRIHHQIFIPSKQLLNKIIITRKIVKNYFDSLEPKELLYAVNQ
jgi:hypothetical protein